MTDAEAVTEGDTLDDGEREGVTVGVTEGEPVMEGVTVGVELGQMQTGKLPVQPPALSQLRVVEATGRYPAAHAKLALIGAPLPSEAVEVTVATTPVGSGGRLQRAQDSGDPDQLPSVEEHVRDAEPLAA